ncbi:uncharacterized protein LOC115210471 [Octopus sinensis]|uniref:Uncharacterized protein LOC115210471 n=1 Tax=Octopus sinensis TaxID=2607531 RepID=A0A6P7S9S6_9MOLL|nr:uncharacterized protein LOC115210471 [Octopus sinensis]
MATILKAILGKVDRVKKATNSYIDDILVDETVMPATELRGHLNSFGLIAKPQEAMEGGAALGLKLWRDKAGALVFRRGNEIPELGASMSRRELFSVWGKLVGHYPIAGWFRTACSFIKRRAEGVKWNDRVGEKTTDMIQEVLVKVRAEDPVRGSWYVPKSMSGIVWCDASRIAIGVVLEVGGVMVEDAAWLRKTDDCNHINVAELDAVLKGVNLALKCGLHTIEIRTDSATVLGWMTAVITNERRVRTKGAAEMLVKRRLGILRELATEFNLKLSVIFVPSEKNRADVLTRVKRAWLQVPEDVKQAVAAVCRLSDSELRRLHTMHHMGVDRT